MNETLKNILNSIGKPVRVGDCVMLLNNVTLEEHGPAELHILKTEFRVATLITDLPAGPNIDTMKLALPARVNSVLPAGEATLALTFDETKRPKKTKAKIPTKAVPQTVAQVIVVDKKGRVLTMHRSERVKSAPNVWSFPSGSQEFGEPMDEAARRELSEEYGLTVLAIDFVGVYENVPGDGYHWVIFTFVALVEDVEAAENKEPELHDKMEFVDAARLKNPTVYLKDFGYHQSFEVFFMGAHDRINASIAKLITATEEVQG